jgi:leucyl aminopeptidase
MKKNKQETHFPRTPFLLAVLLAGVFASGCVAAEEGRKTWITVGDSAYQKLKQVAPQVLAKQSQAIETSDVHSKVKTSETVHLLQVNEEEMLKLSGAVHHELKRCGGYMFHSSEAEGKKALTRKQVTPAATAAVATLSRPAYVIDNQTIVPPILNQMQDSNIAQTITDLSTFVNRYYTTTGGNDASNWLKTKWTSIAAGRSDISVTQFAHSGYNQKSVIATITGTDNPAEVIVLGGHLDSINQSNTGETGRAPGADDDASGIASLTEAFRAMVASGYKPRRTIKFMGYAAEEVGLRGSQAIAQNFKTNNVNVVGVMQLDMTNYKGSASDIYIYTDYTDSLQNDFLVKVINTYLPTLTIGYDRCGYGCSDHASWTAAGYPASLPFEASFNQDNPYIHTANDTLANSGNQAVHALKFARLAAAFAVELGSDGPVPGDKVETFTGTLTKGQKKNFGPFKAAVGSFKADTTGTGDTDLYVRKTAAPTTTTYNCKSEGPTSTETCTVNLTANGDMYVMLNGYSASSYTLKVSYRPQ